MVKKDTFYKTLPQETLGERMQVIGLRAEAILQCKNLDEITGAEELTAALKQQCEVDTPSALIRLRKGPAGTQIATIKLPGQ